MSAEKETTHLLLRLPRDMKTWLERQAARTLSSQNSEILRCIRERMDREPVNRGVN
jgi:hypothetical protein